MTKSELSHAVGSISTRYIQEADAYFNQALHPVSVRKILMLAAVLITALSLCAFTYAVFSTMAGDNLLLTATYSGNGVVLAQIENQSSKDLLLEPTARLLYYRNHTPVESTGQEPELTELKIPANSTQTVSIDFSNSYDIGMLESLRNDYILLQLTNNGFLPGQKWTCNISFSPYAGDYVPQYVQSDDTTCAEGVLPSLKAYFENYTPDVFARWADTTDYFELVEAELSRVEGNIVAPSDPYLLVDCFDYSSASQSSCFDGYNKILGRTESEKIRQIGVTVPNLYNGELNGTQSIPLFYLYTYAVSDIQSPDDYAFIRGNLVSFRELEEYKVYEDDQFVVYELHSFVYSDLHTYVEEMVIQNDCIYLDDAIWRRIQRFYEKYSDREYMESCFFYAPEESRPRDPLSIDDVVKIAQKGEQISFDDLLSYYSRWTDIDEAKGHGMSFEIDDDYELFYAMHPDGTSNGYYLYHNPTGDRIDIRYEDVIAFVEGHGEPEPRCECADTQTGDHSWHLTLDWLVQKGTDIRVNDFISACNASVQGSDFPVYHYPVDDNYHVEVCWYVYDESGEAVCTDENILVVHTASGDHCDPRTTDLSAFIEEHS